MWRKRFLCMAGAMAMSSLAWTTAGMAADLGYMPPEPPLNLLPPPPPPPPPPVVFGYVQPFPYRPYGCGNGCGVQYSYPYYVPYANHPPSYYRPYYKHYLGLGVDCRGACSGGGYVPAGAVGWGGYGYK